MRRDLRLWRLCTLFAALSSFLPMRVAGAGQTQLTLTVDAATPWLGRIPVRVAFAARAGRLTLAYPNWIPGMHAAQGPIQNVGHIALSLDGRPLAWRRDPYDPYLIHATVPEGGQTVEATFDYVSPARPSFDDCVYGVAADRSLAVLNPSAFALAPAGNPHNCLVLLRVRMPHGWTSATALRAATGQPPATDWVEFAPSTLYTLIDSPIMMGAYHRSVRLPTPPGDVPHTLELYGETAQDLHKEALFAPRVTRLVAESGRMFGVRHYRDFHYLLALTTAFGPSALEHHECSLYVMAPTALDPGIADAWDENLIPHEFVHSWCGKYRRPYGENPKSDTDPQSSDLMWVYEGLTEYLGEVLMVRCGFRSAEEWRTDLTNSILSLRNGTGRDWQSLSDAAIMASHTYIFQSGTSQRPIDDIYYEGRLVWLEADMIVRRESRGARSLDDFCRLFFGGKNRGAEVRPYRRQDIVAALNRVQPHDWEAFLRERVDSAPQGPPTAGIEAAGWRISEVEVAAGEKMDLRHFDQMLNASVGMQIVPYQGVFSVYSSVPGSPADRAGITVGMPITAVNGTPFSTAALLAALRATSGGQKPLELLITDDGKPRTIVITGLDGARLPALTRAPGMQDLLTAVCNPQVQPIKPDVQ